MSAHGAGQMSARTEREDPRARSGPDVRAVRDGGLDMLAAVTPYASRPRRTRFTARLARCKVG